MITYWRCVLRNGGYISKDILIKGDLNSTPHSINSYLESYDWDDRKGTECNCTWFIEKATQDYIEENDDLGGE